MKNRVVHSLSAIALMVGAGCCAHAALAGGKPPPPAINNTPSAQAPTEEVIVSVAGLYGDWKMVLPEWPGFAKPVTGDFCDFKRRGDGVAIVCADDFLQKIPDVTFKGEKLRMRWGGALTHTIYDAVRQENGSFDGEIIQAAMGMVSHRFKAQMQRVSEQPPAHAPQPSAAVLHNYFDDLASGSIREKY